MVKLCCNRGAACSMCLRSIAAFLAHELGYDTENAVNRSAANYRADLGENYCTAEQAQELRRLTVLACEQNLGARRPPYVQAIPWPKPPLVLADDLAEDAAPVDVEALMWNDPPDAEFKLGKLFWLVLLLLALLALA
jgi:hypothetical protein